jgi:para-aminobenzoate synthetase
MRVLLIDNYDSFTYNLYQYVSVVAGTKPVVLCNDDWEALAAYGSRAFDAVIVSPGPGSPERERDFGISRWAISQERLPLLGVCLGHQGLCLQAGARIDLAPEPMHGRVSQVWHDGDGLFDGVESPFGAVRYHSLLAYDLPAELHPIAGTADGLLMAVRHRSRPHWGVQFHPESIGTEAGMRILENFCRMAGSAVAFVDNGADASAVPRLSLATTHAQVGRECEPEPVGSGYELHVRAIDVPPDAETAFSALFSQDPAPFWLDTSLIREGLSRYSVLGGAGGPLAETIEYTVGRPGQQGVLLARSAAGETVRHESIFDYLGRELSRRRVPHHGLPFDFSLGYVGYFGYELKADCGANAVHQSETPDARFVFCDRALVIDHVDNRAWLLALSRAGENDVPAWLDDASAALASALPEPLAQYDAEVVNGAMVATAARHGDARYLELIAESQREIRNGESYEICLTNMLTIPLDVAPWDTYRILRRVNPAPFSAFLRYEDFSVLSSSPERFLRVGRDGIVDSKPIKGTRPRGATEVDDSALAVELRSDEKERAENLMIVDLVRNDIGRVASIGSVHVPVLFAVESYATVHQLVSTVRGMLADSSRPVEAVRTAFPGGSMTGAPKLRTMEILDRLEAGPRGIYSGAIGYLSLSGAVDLSIVIRTMVIRQGQVTIGVGGAITALSDPSAELEETRVKSRALLKVLAAAARAGAAVPAEREASV